MPLHSDTFSSSLFQGGGCFNYSECLASGGTWGFRHPLEIDLAFQPARVESTLRSGNKTSANREVWLYLEMLLFPGYIHMGTLWEGEVAGPVPCPKCRHSTILMPPKSYTPPRAPDAVFTPSFPSQRTASPGVCTQP